MAEKTAQNAIVSLYTEDMETKTIAVNGVPTFVTISGEGKPLLCLHGWGKHVDHHAFDELRSALKNSSVQVIAPDLPGFGMSAEPPWPWSVDDYADFIEGLVKELTINNQQSKIFLLGHSFGGRVAIKLAARQGCHGERNRTMTSWISRLYLCAAAGVGRDLLIRRRFWLCIAKAGNILFAVPVLRMIKPFARRVLYKMLRVRDYHDASERMRKTMAVVVEEDLTPLLEKITVPTDLFWGEEDTITPLRDGELMNKKIAQSVLHTFAGVRHRVHREKAVEIAQAIQSSL
jgi:pimeloyl-ACP methyl ester carboxylesterase